MSLILLSSSFCFGYNELLTLSNVILDVILIVIHSFSRTFLEAYGLN